MSRSTLSEQEIETKMNEKFPGAFKWVCQADHLKKPYLNVTDKWPS